MATSGIYIKFRIFSTTDTYFAVGSSTRGSFSKNLGTGSELLNGRIISNLETDGEEVFTSIDLGGNFGNFTVRLYAENELGIRSAYDEEVTAIMGNDLGDNTFTFADVICPGSKIKSRSMSGSMFDADNLTEVSLNFSGNQPRVAWSLHAPPGHPLEGEVLDSNVSFDRLLNGFDLQFYRSDSSGGWELVDSDSDEKAIQDAFPEWGYDDNTSKWSIGFAFEIYFTDEVFKTIAGDHDDRKIKIRLEARTATFAADATERKCFAEIILENEKTVLLSKFINTIRNDFHFAFEVQDLDFKKVLVKQYIKQGVGDWKLGSKKEVANLSSAERKSASVVLPQKWSNGRPDSEYRNQYQYIIEVYDAFGLSATYCAKDNTVQKIDSYTVDPTNGILDARTFESKVRIDSLSIVPVDNTFNISWALRDVNGNSVVFKEDELDQIAVIKGIVGYFENDSGSYIVDAFNTSESGNRFQAGISKNEAYLNSKLKQETFKTLIDGISFEENKEIQNLLATGIYDPSSSSNLEASRSLRFRLIILDAAGQIIDEKVADGENTKPKVITTDGGISVDVFDPLGSVKFNLEFNESITKIEVYRRPELGPTGVDNLPTRKRYGQKSPNGEGVGDYSLSENTTRATQYNETSSGITFGSTASNNNFVNANHLVKTQVPEQSNSSSEEDNRSMTLVDRDVPLLRSYADNQNPNPKLENFTDYDYILLPYDSFGAGEQYFVEGVSVASYKMFSENDRGFIGALDIKPPSQPSFKEIKTSFKNWFLEWNAADEGEKSITYKVTMVRDARSAQTRSGESAVTLTKGSNDAWVKWARTVGGSASTGESKMATVYNIDGSKVKVSVEENQTEKNVSRYISTIANNLTMSDASITQVTVEEFFCDTTSLQIEGDTNQTGYFFLEAIDKTGNHSKFGVDVYAGVGQTLGQTPITGLTNFEQEITSKLPGTVVLVPSDPFDIKNTNELHWDPHFIYKDGESQFIESGEIKLTKELFVGEKIPTPAHPAVMPDEWSKANKERYIKYVYWNPEGGYDTTTETFKQSEDNTSGSSAWEKMSLTEQDKVDQNISYSKEGYYSFSTLNPSSAVWNIINGGHADVNTTATNVLVHEDNFENTPYKLDLSKVDTATWNTHREYRGDSTSVNTNIRGHYGIHMPVEDNDRVPLVKGNDSNNNKSGSIVVARINLVGDDPTSTAAKYSVTSAWHSFANAVIGSASIDEASINSAHINDLTADKITGGRIQGHEIILAPKAEESNLHQNDNGNSTFAQHGIIKSDGYSGLYGGTKGFWINGDGTFSFSTAEGSSLSFSGNELLLRGRLVQPTGKPTSSIRMVADADTVTFNEIQVAGAPQSSIIDSPSSGEVNVTIDIDNAIFSDGSDLLESNFRVKVYPENYSNATKKTLTEFKSGTPVNNEVWYLEAVQGSTTISNITKANLNDGVITQLLDFDDEPHDDSDSQEKANGEYPFNHKFLMKTSAGIVIPEYFSLEVELSFNADNTGFQHSDQYSYSVGDVVTHNDGSGAKLYTAQANVPTGIAITEDHPSSSIDTYWKEGAATHERIIANNAIHINSFIKPSSALAYELKATPGSQVLEATGAGVKSTINFFANLGTEERIQVDSGTTMTETWILNNLSSIKVYREYIIEGTLDSYAAGTYNAGDMVIDNNNEEWGCIATTTQEEPSSSASDWIQLSKKQISQLDDNQLSYTKNQNEIHRRKPTGDNGTYFGVGDHVFSRQIKFTAEDGGNQIASETIDLLASGVNAGTLVFKEDGSQINVISRGFDGSGNKKQLSPMNNKLINWEASFTQGSSIVDTITGNLTITASTGALISKSNIPDPTGTRFTASVEVDDPDNVKRIALTITSTSGPANKASAKEEISIVNAIDVAKNLNIFLPRQFIFFSRAAEHASHQNLLRLENIIPFRVYYGDNDAVLNEDDELTVVPNFGYIVNGAALKYLLNNYTGSVTYNDLHKFGSVTDGTKLESVRADINAAFPTGFSPANSGEPYKIYKSGGEYKFDEIDDDGSTTGSTIEVGGSGDLNQFYYFIPENKSGDDAAAVASKISIKSTLVVNDQGITSSPSLIHKDVQQLGIVELTRDGKDQLLIAAANNSMTVNIDGNKLVSGANSSSGDSEITFFRGDTEIFLAPQTIKVGTEDFVINRSRNYIEYNLGDYSVTETEPSFEIIPYTGATNINATVSAWTHIKDGTADRIVVENSALSLGLDSSDAKVKRVVLVDDNDAPLAHFSLSWTQNSLTKSLSSSDFIKPLSNRTDAITASVDDFNFAQTYNTNYSEPTAPNNNTVKVAAHQQSERIKTKIDLSHMNGTGKMTSGAGTAVSFVSFNFPFKVYVPEISTVIDLSINRTVATSEAGAAGPSFVYRGGYSASEQYYGTSDSQDVVKFSNGGSENFYIVQRNATRGASNETKGTLVNPADPSGLRYDYIIGVPPTDDATPPNINSSYWQATNSLEPTATNLLLADDILVKRGIVVGIDTERETNSKPSGFIASQLDPKFLSVGLTGLRINANSYSTTPTSSTPRETDKFVNGSYLGINDMLKSSGELPYKTPGDGLPGLFLGKMPITYATSGNTTSTFLTSQLEMYSPFGNYLRWNGKNLEIKGAIISASIEEDVFATVIESESLLQLSPSNPQVGPQTFVGGGFANRVTNNNYTADDNYSFPTLASSIVGGGANRITANNSGNARFSTICGGFGNRVSDSFSIIGGGYNNSIGASSTDLKHKINSILSGANNTVDNSAYSFIGGGSKNFIDSSVYSSIVNGYNNFIGGSTLQSSLSPSGYSNDAVDNVYVEGFGDDGVDLLSNGNNAQRANSINRSTHTDDTQGQYTSNSPEAADWQDDSTQLLLKSIPKYKLNIGFSSNALAMDEKYNIFNNLTFERSKNSGTGDYRIFNTGYKTGDEFIYIRAAIKSNANSGRVFHLGYYDGNNFRFVKIKTSTLHWPYVAIQHAGQTGNSYDIYKFIISRDSGGSPKVTLEKLDGSDVELNSLSTSTGGGNYDFNASVQGGDSEPTAQQINISIPGDLSKGHFAYNGIFGGDYNSIMSCRRSTVAGGRNNLIKFSERAITSGLNNIIIGEEKLATEDLPQGFVVFGSENGAFLSGMSDSTGANAKNFTDSYKNIHNVATPPNYQSLSNVIFGRANLIRNTERTSVIGSANEILINRPDGTSAADLSQVGAEITILGTDNKINVDESVQVSNLGIFGTNFNLTTSEMVQNTFYIGNPQSDSDVSISKLTRVFIAADGGAFFTGDVISFALSDKKYKENISLIKNPIEKIKNISGITFDWKNNQEIYSGRDVGVLAQEIKEVLPEVVEDGRTGLKVKYEKITPLLIEAIKTQQTEIDLLKQELKKIKSTIYKLKK